MKILYVEDNPANLFLVKRVAKIGGHEVINYIDGEEALRNYAEDAPDLVLMDIELSGGLNGLDVVRELRKRGYTTPIVAVTAYAMVGDRERCLDAGCDEYIAKPIPIPQLVSVIDQFNVQLASHVDNSTPTSQPSTRTTEKLVRPPLDRIIEDTAHANRETEMMPVSPLQNMNDASIDAASPEAASVEESTGESSAPVPQENVPTMKASKNGTGDKNTQH